MHEHIARDAKNHNKLFIGRLNKMKLEKDQMKLENDRQKEEIARLKASCTCQRLVGEEFFL